MQFKTTKTKRRPLDAYYTPQNAVETLINTCGITFDGTEILEPCAGEKAISSVFDTLPVEKVYTNDIDPTKDCDWYCDATNETNWRLTLPLVDWVVSNPPFNQAMPILKNAYEYSNQGVIFLLRLSFLEPTLKRRDWLKLYPPTQLIVIPRIIDLYRLGTNEKSNII